MLIFPTNTYGNPVFRSKTALTYAGRVMGGLLDPHKLRTRFTLPAYWGLCIRRYAGRVLRMLEAYAGSSCILYGRRKGEGGKDLFVKAIFDSILHTKVRGNANFFNYDEFS